MDKEQIIINLRIPRNKEGSKRAEKSMNFRQICCANLDKCSDNKLVNPGHFNPTLTKLGKLDIEANFYNFNPGHAKR